MYDVHALNLINEAPLFGDINLDSLPNVKRRRKLVIYNL